MRLHRALSITALLVIGCRFDASGLAVQDGQDTTDAAPISTPTADAAIPVDAPPGCVSQCMDNDTLCTAEGTLVDCPLGCSDTGGAHCRYVVPSNGATMEHLDGVTSGLVIGNGATATINTETGRILVGATEIRGPVTNAVDKGMGFYLLGQTLAVLAVNHLQVSTNATLQPTGARGLIVLSRGDVAVSGLIDISAGCADGTPECPGPGGGKGATGAATAQLAAGCAPGGNGQGQANGGTEETGGAGGGLGKLGAAAGIAMDNTPGGAAAVLGNCPGETLVPLAGGSGGGKGGVTNRAEAGNGGGGGGALQITSQTQIVVAAGGEIWAGGAGGAPGTSDNGEGGGGGGSGGAILLEAPKLMMVAGAILTANGGGGGGGGGNAVDGQPGYKGTRTLTPALGGMAGDLGSAGGNGGAGATDAQPGVSGADGTGGGGGGVGIIRFNVPTNDLSTSGALLSPDPTSGDPVIQ